MARPMTLAEQIAAYNKWHVPFDTLGNPSTFHRPGGWGPVYGCVVHHTGVESHDKDLNICRFGREGLAGPLSQTFAADDDRIKILSTGRSSHAGKGALNTLRAVMSENYSGIIKPGPDAIDFNRHFYGEEIGYSGMGWMGDDRYKVVLLEKAARCDHHGWSAKSVIAHGELTRRKWDLGRNGKMMDMDQMRRDIQVLLDHGPGQAKDVVSTAKFQTTKAVAPLGRISLPVLKIGNTSASVGYFKKALRQIHGKVYIATMYAKYGKGAMEDNTYNQATVDMCVALYRYWGAQDSSWLQGDLRTPGEKMLIKLGFEVLN